MMILAVWRLCLATIFIHLRSRGIEAHKFNKVIPRLTKNWDHRKILVIDGQVAYTGGSLT